MWIRAWNYTCRTLKFAHNKFFSKKYLKRWRNEKIDTQKNMQSTLGEVEHETFFASNGNSEKKFEPQMAKIKKVLALLTIYRYGKPEMA